MTPDSHRARTAVAVVFAVNGFLYASLVSRVPALRDELALDNGGLGLLLLMIAVGSLAALPVSGALVARFGPAAIVCAGLALDVVGLVVVATGAQLLGSAVVVGGGLAAYGAGAGLWDVAMNVEGAAVERRVGRTILPRFHAGFSLGTVVGALAGVVVVRAGLDLTPHLTALAGLGAAAVVVATRRFLPAADDPGSSGSGAAWREPRTILIGLMVLTFAVGEGSANDWLALAVVDGYDAAAWVGIAGYAVFVAAMTAGRLVGPVLLDTCGRAPTLWASAALVAAGVALVVVGGAWPWVALGCVVWGLGAALGFPVGISAAADEPARAAARVSVVSTIGYAAFLVGPPLLGALGERVGTLRSLYAVALLMAPAAMLVLAARPPADVRDGGAGRDGAR